MRRIIERKVTVVTTTTWTISWESEPLHPLSKVDSVHSTESNTDDLSTALATPDSSTIIEIQEADPESQEQPTKQNPLSHDLHSYPSKTRKEIEP